MKNQKEAFIPKSKSPAKRLKATKKEEPKDIPEDLRNKWAAVVAIATTHKLLQEGHFLYAHRNSVGVSLAFLEELHTNALMDASKHPQAELIPEISKLVSEKAKKDEQKN